MAIIFFMALSWITKLQKDIKDGDNDIIVFDGKDHKMFVYNAVFKMSNKKNKNDLFYKVLIEDKKGWLHETWTDQELQARLTKWTKWCKRIKK